MPTHMSRLCVFCGTNAGARPEYGAAAPYSGRAPALVPQKTQSRVMWVGIGRASGGIG
jgi:hypothetical protein